MLPAFLVQLPHEAGSQPSGTSAYQDWNQCDVYKPKGRTKTCVQPLPPQVACAENEAPFHASHWLHVEDHGAV